MKLFKLILSIILIFWSVYVAGQKTSVRFLPKGFKSYCKSSEISRLVTNKLEFERFSNDVEKGTEWRVFSLNSSNILYRSYDCTDENGSKLDFMQPLLVLDVIGNSLKVCDPATRHPLGWLSASQLVLSDHSLLNPNGLPRKAILLTSLNDINRDFKPSDIKNISVYKDSKCTDLDKYASTDLWSIYYVIAETNEAFLLSKNDILIGNSEQIKGSIFGWVKKFSVTNWDYRVCFEENYSDTKAVEDYDKKFLPIFRKQNALEDYLESPNAGKPSPEDSSGIIYEVQLTESMPSARDPRFPILKNVNDEKFITETIVVGNVGGQQSSGEPSSGESRKIVDEIIARLRNINVVFVIDATHSMTKFYKPVVNALNSFFDFWKASKSYNKLQVGCILYRDYLDNPSFEVLPLTGDEAKVINYLNNIQTISLNKLLPEAQFNGIVNGVEKMRLDPRASNIFVIIGDAGNKENDKYNVDDVVRTLKKYNGNVVSFQVNDGNHPTFRDFRSDMNAIVRGVCDNVKNMYTYEASPTIKNTFVLKTLDTETDYFYNIGRFSYASQNLAMDVNFLQQSLLECLEVHSQKVDKAANDLTRGGGRILNNPGAMAMLREGGATKEILKNAWKIQGSAKGFTFWRAYGMNTDIYSKVVFVSQNELNEIRHIFNKLVVAIENNGTTMAKSAFKEAVLAQCRRMIGESNDNTILDKSIGAIWEAILGIDFEGDYRIKDIPLRDLDKVDDGVFQKFSKKLESSAKSFNSNSYENRWFLENNTKFYYIPLDHFPGNKE
jgi:hypothetical protein